MPQFKLDAPGKPVGRDQVSKVFYWVVPANVTGEWRLSSVRRQAAKSTCSSSPRNSSSRGRHRIRRSANRSCEEVKLDGAHCTFKARLPNASAAGAVV